MKLAIVNNDLTSGGAEKLIYDMSLILKDDIFLELDIIILTSKKEVYKKELQKKGINVICLNSKFGIYNPLLTLKLIKILKNYDVVHAHVFPSQYWVGIAAKFLSSKIKFITTEHNTTNRRRKKIFYYYLDNFIYSSFDKIVSITKEVQVNLIEWLKPKNKEKFIIIENGIQLEKFYDSKAYSRTKMGYKKEDKLIAMVARFSTQKDQLTLIKAIKELPEDYKLILIGEGQLMETCEKLVKNLGIQFRVSFLGFRKDIPEILKMCDIGVLSSHFEGLPLSILEIMAAGLVFIGSDVPGINDLIKDEGILYEHQNEKELSQKIKLIVENKEMKEKFLKKSKEKIKRYDLKSMVEKYNKIYNENKIISNRRS